MGYYYYIETFVTENHQILILLIKTTDAIKQLKPFKVNLHMKSFLKNFKHPNIAPLKRFSLDLQNAFLTLQKHSFIHSPV